MEGPPLLSSICILWGVLGSICVLLVRSELPINEFRRVDPSEPLFPSPPPPLLSPPPPSPPPPSPPPPSPPPPPPPYTTPPPASSPPPPASSPPPPSLPPPPPKFRRAPPPPLKSTEGPKNKTNPSKPHPPRRPRGGQDQEKNHGKLIGYWFAGAAGILQLGVIGFLVYKKREISKITDRHESFS